ncbi:MAG: tetratricopeptide repeat protein [Tannerella sp.]|jgi:tetratricopeptide (TPR) repeat protein|nr:tetratricopeptide repeat protein [Tannerella sp.]
MKTIHFSLVTVVLMFAAAGCNTDRNGDNRQAETQAAAVDTASFTPTGNAQLDSLLRLLPNAKKDSSLVLLYINIGKIYRLNDYTTATAYFFKAKEMSEEIGYQRGYLMFAAEYTQILNMSGKLDSSLILNKKAIDVARKSGNDTDIGKAYYNTGNVFYFMNMFDSTIIYYNHAKQYFRDDPEGSARISYATLTVYNNLKRYDEAKKAGEDALQYYRKMNNPTLIGNILLNLGVSYLDSDPQQIDSIKKARQLESEALEIADKIRDDRLKSLALINLGDTYIRLSQQDHPQMKIYYEEALALAKKTGNPDGKAIAWRGLGIHYFHTKNYEKSLVCLDSSLVVSNQNNLIYEKAKTFFSKSSVLFAMGQLKEAEAVLAESDEIQNKLTGDEIQERIVQAEKKYETEKKELEIER